MSGEEIDAYLKGLRERSQEYTLGLDLIQAKEVGMLEHDEEEDEDDGPVRS
jgi:hypothetical protein